MRHVAGIDPSLTGTGIAVITKTVPWTKGDESRIFLTTELIKVPAKGVGPAAESERVTSIVDAVCESTGSAELVNVESLALNSRTGKYAERAHLYYALIAAFLVRRKAFDTLTPSQLKKRTTGNGRADKEEVLAAVREAWGDRGWHEGLKGGRYDRADAAALAWVAAEAVGIEVPAYPHTRLPHAA